MTDCFCQKTGTVNSAPGVRERLNGQMIEWYIVKEDIPRFHKLQNDIMNGESPEDILLRFYIKDDKHDYAWCNVSFPEYTLR